MASLPLKGLVLVPERSQLVVEHAQHGDDNHAHIDVDRQPEPTRSPAGNRPQSAHQSPAEVSLLIDGLRRQLQQEARTATGNNELRSKQFSERITELMNRYTNQQLTAAEIIAELIRLSKEIVKESKRGEQFTPPLGNDELTFFDAVSTNESATELMDDEVLAEIARQLVSMLRRDGPDPRTVDTSGVRPNCTY